MSSSREDDDVLSCSVERSASANSRGNGDEVNDSEANSGAEVEDGHREGKSVGNADPALNISFHEKSDAHVTCDSSQACDKVVLHSNVGQLDNNLVKAGDTGGFVNTVTPNEKNSKLFNDCLFTNSSSQIPNQRHRSFSMGSALERSMKHPTIICDFYAKGWCIKGNSCMFRHEKPTISTRNAWNMDGLDGPYPNRIHETHIGLGSHVKIQKSVEPSPSESDLLSKRLLVREYGGHPSHHEDQSQVTSREHMRDVSPVKDTLPTDKINDFSVPNVQNPLAPRKDFSEFDTLGRHQSSKYPLNESEQMSWAQEEYYRTSKASHREESVAGKYPEILSFDRKDDFDKFKKSSSPVKFPCPVYNFSSPGLSLNHENHRAEPSAFSSPNHLPHWEAPSSSNFDRPFNRGYNVTASSNTFSYGTLMLHSSGPLGGDHLSTGNFIHDERGFKLSSPQNSSPYFLKLGDSLRSSGIQKPSFSSDWEPSVPFRSSICPLTRVPSSFGGQYDPLLDSVEPSNEGIKPSHMLSFSSQEMLNNNVPYIHAGGSNVIDQHDVDFMGLSNEEHKTTMHSGEKHHRKAKMKEVNSEDRLKHDYDIKLLRDPKALRVFRLELVNYMKGLVKPSWRGGHLSKDVHNTIVKRAVDKVLSSMPPHQIPTTTESISQYLSSAHPKLLKLIEGYVDRYTKA